MAEILIVEDDLSFAELLALHLEERGHEVRHAASLDAARRELERGTPEAVLLDQQLPDGHGTELLAQITAQTQPPPVIVVTGVVDNQLVIEAMRRGAYDFVRKPLDPLELDTTLDNALRQHRLSHQVAVVLDDRQRQAGEAIIGTGPAMVELLKTVGRVAASDACVLITGESGSGKEVIARAIHAHSGRRGPFLAVNCSAIVETLLESELFGHEKGAFTGAVERKAGMFEVAAEGTLFLDEIGELPLPLQAKLLRVLQEGRFQRVGGSRELVSTARILAATHRDLPAMVRDGRFREDLLFRIDVIHLHLPPLRERPGDLAPLAEHLLGRINRRLHRRVQRISEAAWRRIAAYPWPGNVRELENVLTRAVLLAHGDTLTPESVAITPPEPISPEVPAATELISLEAVEARHVAAILRHTHWHKGQACEILGISRPALDRKIAKYALDHD